MGFMVQVIHGMGREVLQGRRCGVMKRNLYVLIFSLVCRISDYHHKQFNKWTDIVEFWYSKAMDEVNK